MRSDPPRGKDAGPDEDASREPLDARKALILRTVVQEHVQTGQPVGSTHLTAAGGLHVSSATIRNEMSVLEREGYLTHPHTSAGRIPTDRGYRYFVDSLGRAPKLNDTKVAQVRQFFESARHDIEQLMTDATRLLSNLTDFAAVVVANPTEAITIRSVQVVDLGSTGLVVVVLSNGAVEKETISLEPGVGDAAINAASARLTTSLAGSAVHEARALTLMSSGDARVDAICRAAVATLRERTPDHDGGDVFVGGASRVVGSFDTVETIRQVLTTLEEQYVVVNLIREALDRTGTQSTGVSIGAEHGSARAFESLLSCSVVVAPYVVDGRAVGTVGVLGPTRMDYPQAMAAVAAVSDGLGEHLSD
jgi:heat-inducible transcriptional repressor